MAKKPPGDAPKARGAEPPHPPAKPRKGAGGLPFPAKPPKGALITQAKAGLRGRHPRASTGWGIRP
ncbi:hypothetical protein GCM10023209_11420 [Roseibacterium beibuensis]|uniref:Uncharacterized protein n=1 Tax=[Roseibacterium] beibuensis TaxID=1193142 RepID=A0ABP9L1Z9_9RHOB